jgi:two-component system, NtrC family, response regulator HydG
MRELPFESGAEPPAGAAAGDGAVRASLGDLRGGSPAMNRLYRQVIRVAATEAAVLVVGERGTGKELVAQTLHALGARAAGPFVPLNCGAIPQALVEAELFGNENAAGGAREIHAGYLEQASGGTLFLDEVGELEPAMQVKLLHVLEQGTFFRVGGSEEVRADARIIAATHRDLWEAARQGRFRDDLLYRLAVFPLQVPPLRERREDIEPLARHFVETLNARERARKILTRRALDVLRAHSWPGNVRELGTVIQRAYILADRHIEVPAAQLAAGSAGARGGNLRFAVGTPLAAAQRELIYATLAHFGGDKRRTARALGISLKTLYNRLEAYGDSVNVRRHQRSAA